MKSSKDKIGFTLVELIVTIVILTILGAIAFTSIQGYGKNARDSVRTSDINNIKKNLELFKTEKSFFPLPTNPRDIIFTGATIWKEGTFGEQTRAIAGRINEVPLDPLTKNEYTYSVLTNLLEYQIGFAVENGGFSFLNASFGTNGLRTAIVGTYNAKALLTSTGGKDYILSSPSIITSDASETDFFDIIGNKKLAYNGYQNLPSSYNINNSNLSKVFDFYEGLAVFTDEDNELFIGNFQDLKNQDTRLGFYKKLSDRYNQSTLEGQEDYIDFSLVYADIYNPTLDFIKYSCALTKKVVNILEIECDGGDEVSDIIFGDVDTGALLPNGETNYVGQWPFGDVGSRGQGVGTADHHRNSMGMSGALNKSIGVKWRLFTTNKSPLIYYGGFDVNGDGNENIIYGYGGKIYLGDTITGGNIWETKVLDIRAILGIENILGNGVKSIIVALGNDWYIGVINGANGDLERISNSASGPVKTVKPGWPTIDYKVFDVNGDGINEYHFKQWYNKYNSFRFFNSSGKVIGETLWSSQGYGDYNEGSDGYQPQQWAMGNIASKLVIGTKGSHTFAFYSNDVNPSLSGNLKYKMPAFGKIFVGGNSGNGRNSGIGYFYDINNDGNDEYIYRIDEELNNNKLSRLGVAGLNTSGVMVQYMSLSNPRVVGASGLTSYGNFSIPIALRNQTNPEDSYILSYGRDPVDLVNKWLLLKYKGSLDSGYKKTSTENESFNYELAYNAFDTSYTLAGIYSNGIKDYVVLLKGGEYYFYTFNGINTFLTSSSLKVRGSFFGNTLFDGGYDIRRERNKNAGVFLASYDTNGNGKKEFVVSDGGYFKFYEVEDTGVTFVKQFGPTSGVPSCIKWGLTEDNNDMYALSYNLTTNTINYYRTKASLGNYNFTKITSDNFYSGGEVKDLVISKLGLGESRYNKLMISGIGMFDARSSYPGSPPIKLNNDFFFSYDMDLDGYNEVFIGGKAYTFNAPGSYSLKYNSTGWVGDLNGDGVFDIARSYCTSTATWPNHLFYTIRSGVDGSQIVPDLDRGNGNGYCDGGNSHSNVSEDFDGDGIDELIPGTDARATRVLSISGGVVTEGNQMSPYSEEIALVAFDFDGDGKKEVIRGTNNAGVMKVNSSNKIQLSSLVNIPGDVISTFGISGGIPSFHRFNNKTYVAFRGLDGQVSLKSWNGTNITNNFNNYYLNARKYANAQEILNNNLIPLPTADVLLGDFIQDGSIQVLVGGGDGYIYIIGLNGNIIKAYNIGSAIKRMIFGDTNDDKLLDIIVSAEDGYVYQIASSRINPPSMVRDGVNYGSDIDSQSEVKKVGLSFSSVPETMGYFVQLYNKTHKSIVFDRIDIGSQTSACIVSADVTDASCIKANRNFSLNNNTTYEWRVQSYNESISSPTAVSDGFIIQ
ncbi:prepilin-type N-terminal cleavage/methylation domain-containing protein [Candidatus Gracilibacteria bacterium]|nr:prepilin-type N-terminal cleavage/methylation domain-containing protein [Candidatus Gracilibacteria bacterium]NUJ98375.1 prepilin-type N-terminal cleavage/methylation domain-containing protein [Candidatus Gracilibacteria bacterium]